MEKLSINDLWSLEDYALKRSDFRSSVLAHKGRRVVSLGPNARLIFEDRMTIQYQIQEMLRVERIFERAGIQEELDAYNPLIPDGNNLKATFLIEYEDASERRIALSKLGKVEHHIWLQVTGGSKSWAIADEDLERSNETKTSSVHFLRFDLDDHSISNAKSGKPISIGVEHQAYTHKVAPIPDAVRKTLVADFA